MPILKNNYFSILLIIVISCNRGSLSSSDYVNWVIDEENSLRQTQNYLSINYTIQYKPHDYIILIENGGNNITQKDINEMRMGLGDLLYFDLVISSSQKTLISLLQSQKVNNINELLKAKINNYEVAPSIAHLETPDPITNQIRISFAFDIDKEILNSDFLALEVFYYDELLNNGIIKYKYSKKNITKIPSLKI
jgi:hypothetical protein